ncbi:MAG: hypothetical protein M1837_003017 [Sclerophora amabilis]|nr:MAG: hypothetical protein M1837_003017 [Sclerophora amabilis]
MSPARILDSSAEASKLVSRLFSSNGEIGFMSCAVYDTAWVSMIAKGSKDRMRWLFPQCFEYVLDSQQEDGGWEAYASEIDGILNTAASLLALKSHAERPFQLTSPPTAELERRIDLATSSLSNQLQSWDVTSTVHVGFEILVPSLLRLLESKGLKFEFPGRPALMDLNQIKLSKFKPAYLYATQKSTALHSLEAFVGMIDYDKVAHHKDFGALMASPSSTAAYLMYSSSWDDESEDYLHRVLQKGAGQGSGGIPSAFPSTYFETTWVLSTLLDNGFNINDIGEKQAKRVASFLGDALNRQGGLIGFAPSVEADADDTSKALLSLSKLGQPVSPVHLLNEFESDSHFRTYRGERNSSFTANCNVLLALLSQPNPSLFSSQIEKATSFLCDTWWESDGCIGDKWNLSRYYPGMLMAEAFSSLLKAWDRGSLPSLPDHIIRDRVLISLYQDLIRTLQTQNADGSWGSRQSREETAYAILTISKACTLPFLDSLRPAIDSSIQNGRQFLEMSPKDKSDYLWVEKVTYGSAVLCESYVLAALETSYENLELSDKLSSLVDLPEASIAKFVKFYSNIPLFSSTASWKLRAALIEGYLFTPQIRKLRLDVFPRTGMEEDKYFEYIPFTWTACNNRNNTFLSTQSLKDMMIISFLNYQADEYMEAVVGRHFSGKTSSVVSMIDDIFFEIETKGNKRPQSPGLPAASLDEHTTLRNAHAASNGKSQRLDGQTNAVGNGNPITNGSSTSNGTTNGHLMTDAYEDEDQPSLKDVADVLSSFIRFVMHHPSVLAATPLDHARVKTELRTFLLAHMQQSEDNDRFSTQGLEDSSNLVFHRPRTSFYRWVHSTSANHTSCPYSFAFYQCLLGGVEDTSSPRESFPSTEEKYISEAMCRHLAVMCRMYNDYGSVARDRDEKNLNSINFPDFGPSLEDTKSDDAQRRKLMMLAEYERENMGNAFAKLQGLASGSKTQQRVLEKVQMFCDVTDLYGQIYVARDIASRM